MSEKRADYAEDEIITLEFDDDKTVECGIMGVFDLSDVQYIALELLDDDSEDVYLYEYVAGDTDFELKDIPEEAFEAVAAEFDRLMDEPV
ncbi:MAG: DUF1292 domain-containing protein [Oscillospiraceae bacterium]|nr:DUF1292 domain-containing protein [Oscillospiraceae bacterium]